MVWVGGYTRAMLTASYRFKHEAHGNYTEAAAAFLMPGP